MMVELSMELCKGRHSTPAKNGAIFTHEIKDVTNTRALEHEVHCSLAYCCKLDLYVTGLTVALVAVINYCVINQIELTLWHYNKESNDYYSQEVYIPCSE